MSRNAFAECKTLDELKFHWEILTSPENISLDGERSTDEIEKVVQRLASYYNHRYMEISGLDY